MSVQIFLDLVPDYISWTEWKAVYEESLILVEEYPFLDLVRSEVYGRHFYACTGTKGRKIKNENTGYSIWGDMVSRKLGERFYIPGRLKTNGHQKDSRDGDIFLTLLPEEERFACEKPKPAIQRIWGSDTKGQPYTLYLLAIGCLIEARLPGAAVVWGDITGNQCRKAIRWANQYLDLPIELSDRANSENLYKRVERMGFEGAEKMKAFRYLKLDGSKEVSFNQSTQKLQVFNMSGEPSNRFIDCADELIYYKTGDRIFSELDRELRHKADFLKKIGGEDYDKNFLGLKKRGRIEFMTRAAGRFLMSMDFWKEVFARCLDDDYMRKVYPIARIRAEEQNTKQLYYAWFLNDELRKRYE